MSHDAAIRDALVAHLRATYPGGLVVQEWRIGNWPNVCIADVATVDASEIVGYEIKSERDTCTRLTRQAAAYDRVCDRCVLVAAPRHIAKARGILGPWWGLVAWDGALHVEREAYAIPEAVRNVEGMLEVLWCDELRQVALAHSLPRVGSKRVLIERIVAGVESHALRGAAREILRSRTDWRDATGRNAGRGARSGRLAILPPARNPLPRATDPRQADLFGGRA